MGKASRWFKGLLGIKKYGETAENNSYSGERKAKKWWGFLKPEITYDDSPAMSSARLKSFIDESEERSKHAIAVAAATTAAADAAIAAAQAAVAVVRLTSRGRGSMFSGSNQRWAATKIQSVFRGYLARKALRALKGLVKLQALVRGYLVRKRTAEALRSMEAIIRAQAQALVKAERYRSINLNHHQRKCRTNRRAIRSQAEKHDDFYSRNQSFDSFESESPKVVEMDTCRPETRYGRLMNSSNWLMPEYCNDDQYYCKRLSSFSCRIPTHSMPSPANSHHYKYGGFLDEDYKFSTAQNTPRFACSGRATPTRSFCGDSLCPNPSYMAYTESSKAKLRSQSAPKQRPESGPKRRLSLSEVMGSRMSFSGIRMQRSSCSQVEEELEF